MKANAQRSHSKHNSRPIAIRIEKKKFSGITSKQVFTYPYIQEHESSQSNPFFEKKHIIYIQLKQSAG